MSLHALIRQTNRAGAAALAAAFARRGDTVTLVDDLTRWLRPDAPPFDLIVIDLSAPDWATVVAAIQTAVPGVPLLLLSDPAQAAPAAAQALPGVTILQEPVDDAALDAALPNGVPEAPPAAPDRNRVRRVRQPLIAKLALPFLLLFFCTWLALSLVDSPETDTAFADALVSTGQLVADNIVREEERLLATLRLVAFTEPVADAVLNADAETLRSLTLPLAVNGDVEAVEFLDDDGRSILSLRRPSAESAAIDFIASRGEGVYAEWPFVATVLEGVEDGRGDKYGGLVTAPWGTWLYVAGPVDDGAGEQLGTVLVGESLTTLARRLRESTRAHIILYNESGQPLVSTLAFDDSTAYALATADAAVLQARPDNSLTREVVVADVSYTEIVAPVVIRGEVAPALVGTLLPRPATAARLQPGWTVWLFLLLAFVIIGGATLYFTRRASWQMERLARAARRLARGEAVDTVPVHGADEIALVSTAFNTLVESAAENRLFRDLLNRTPRRAMRQDLQSAYRNGLLHLAGESGIASIIRCRLHDFETLALTDDDASERIIALLNAFYAGVVQPIIDHDGVVTNFNGELLVAGFGLLPKLLSPTESALAACHAAAQIALEIDRLNWQRQMKGLPSLQVGITVNTGSVISGAVQHDDSTRFTMVGETLVAAERLERIALQADSTRVVVSHYTYLALGPHREAFALTPLGMFTIREKRLVVYELIPGPVRKEEFSEDAGTVNATPMLPNEGGVVKPATAESNDGPLPAPVDVEKLTDAPTGDAGREEGAAMTEDRPGEGTLALDNAPPADESTADRATTETNEDLSEPT